MKIPQLAVPISAFSFQFSAFSLSLSLLTALSFPLSAFPQTAPLRWDVETSRPSQTSLDLYRGETVTLEPRFLSYAAAVNLTNATTVTLRYNTTAMGATYYQVSGSVLTPATNGRVRVIWTPACEGTNNSYSYSLVVSSSTSALYRCNGKIKLLGTVGHTGTASPVEHTEIDWSTVTNLNASLAPFAVKATTLSGYGITNAATSTQGRHADTAYGWGPRIDYLESLTNSIAGHPIDPEPDTSSLTHWWFGSSSFMRPHVVDTNVFEWSSFFPSGLHPAYRLGIKAGSLGTNDMTAPVAESLRRGYESLQVGDPISLLDNDEGYIKATGNLIVVTHRDGSITAYENPTANTDIARGAMLKSVVDGAAQYDHIRLAPAVFDLATNGLICVQNTTLAGSGRLQTIIYSQRRYPAHQTKPEIVSITSGCTLSDLQVNANYGGNTAATDPYQFQFPVGQYHVAASLTDIRIIECLIVGNTDALYFEDNPAAGLNVDVRVYDTRLETTWDTVFFKGVGGDACLYDCDIVVDKNAITPTLAQPRAVSFFGTGTLSLHGCRLTASDGDVGAVGVYAESGTVNIFGGSITSDSSTNVYDITEAGTATINVFAGTFYDPTKISGTPNVSIVGDLTGTVDGTAAATIEAGAAAGFTASQPGHTQPWASITNPPSTYAPSAHNQEWSTITSTPTTRAGYGITDVQPTNAVLTAWGSTTAWADRCIAYSSAATENFAQYTPKVITLGTSTLDAGALSRSGNTVTGLVNGGLYFYQLSTSWSSATAGDIFTVYVYAAAGSISIGTDDGGTAVTPAATGVGSVRVDGFFWVTSANTTLGIKGVTTGAAGTVDTGSSATKITVVRVK